MALPSRSILEADFFSWSVNGLAWRLTVESQGYGVANVIEDQAHDDAEHQQEPVQGGPEPRPLPGAAPRVDLVGELVVLLEAEALHVGLDSETIKIFTPIAIAVLQL